MAPPRRGRSRSFPATELRGTLGTLLRTTLAQAGVVRDALERGAREGRARLDDVRSERRRGDALAELGELVLERVRRGELPELEDIPELADAIAAIEELDAPPRRRGRRDDAAPGRDWIEPASRSRFDRGRGRHDSESDVRTDDRDHPGDDDDDVFDDGYVGEAVRPAGGGRREPAPRSAGAASRGRGDGTVSSSSWTPPRPSSGAQRVWRPVMPEDPAPGHDHGHGDDHDDHDDDDARSPAPVAATPAAAGAPPRRVEPRRVEPRRDPTPAPAPPAPSRRGGIVFSGDDDDASEPDDDLSRYMHPDDVPPR